MVAIPASRWAVESAPDIRLSYWGWNASCCAAERLTVG
jgi:hypothetical protein